MVELGCQSWLHDLKTHSVSYKTQLILVDIYWMAFHAGLSEKEEKDRTECHYLFKVDLSSESFAIWPE